MDDIIKHEELVDRYIKAGKTDAAIKSLLFLITKYAQKHDFETANSLREKIITIDPMALTDAIKAHEIIEDSRRRPVDKGHMEVWSRLYDTLTMDEANILFNDMQERTFRPGETIFSQGTRNTYLYFINSGQAKHLYLQDNREMFLKRISTGNIAGEDTFFDATLCTTSLFAIDRVKAHFLEAGILTRWQGTAPGLEKKLRAFCEKEEKIHDLLKRNAMDRRTQRRVLLPGRILIRLVSNEGEPIGQTLRGHLGDVSVGGISFQIKVKERGQAQLLLGRKLHVRFNMPPTMTEVERIGIALGVRYKANDETETDDDFSVHIKFDDLLTNKALNDVERFLKVMNPS